MDLQPNTSMELLEQQIKGWALGPEPRTHKTHSDLYKLINDNKCGIKITDIAIKSKEDTITMTVIHETGNFCVNYVNVISNGCLVFMDGDEEKQPIESNFLTQFITDLARIIDLQKPNESLSSMTFTIYKTSDLKFLDEIQNFLKNRNLKSQEVRIHCEKQEEILYILTFLNAKSLEKIVIGCSESGALSKEIFGLNQWKSAKHLDTSSFSLAEMDHFLHFSTVIACCDDLALEDVVAVKEKFLQSSQLEHLEIFFENNDQTHNYKKHFGPNFQTWSGERKIWFSRTPKPKQILRFEANPSGIKLNYTDDYKTVGERWINLAMSPECYLLQMPLSVIRKICEKSNLESILSLRKACRDLRDLLIDKTPNAKLTKIEIQMIQYSIILKIWDSLQSEPISITYKDATNECTVAIDRHIPTSSSPEKILESRNFADAFFEDLEIIMKHQKKILKNFTLTTRDINMSGIIDRLTELLRNRTRPMKIEKFELNMEKTSEILKFLDDYNQKKRIYFTSFEAHCNHITFEELMAIKEKFLTTPCLENLELSFENVENLDFIKHFGENFHIWNHSKIWFTRTPYPNKILRFEVKPGGIQMNYIGYYDVPESLINLTMSSECYFLQTPIVVIRRIFDNSSLESILALRKVCRDLRNLLIDQPPDAEITRMSITMHEDSVIFSVSDSSSDYPYCRELSLTYAHTYHGCTVRSGRGWSCDSPKKLVTGRNFVDTFFYDFDIILKHQKGILKNFTLYTIKCKIPGVIARLAEHLQNHPMRTEKIELRMGKQSEVLQIFPLFDAKPIRKHSIKFWNSETHMRAYEGRMDLSDELVSLPQWKNAKKALIHDFRLDKLQHCTHFTSVKASCYDGSLEEMAAIKKKLHEIPTLTHIYFTFSMGDTIYQYLGLSHTMKNDGKEFVVENQSTRAGRRSEDSDDYSE